VEYFQIHIFVSTPERLTGNLSKILSFSQMGNTHVIKGIQSRATRTYGLVQLPDRNKRDTCTSLKAHAHDLMADSITSRNGGGNHDRATTRK